MRHTQGEALDRVKLQLPFGFPIADWRNISHRILPRNLALSIAGILSDPGQIRNASPVQNIKVTVEKYISNNTLQSPSVLPLNVKPAANGMALWVVLFLLEVKTRNVTTTYLDCNENIMHALKKEIQTSYHFFSFFFLIVRGLSYKMLSLLYLICGW